MEMVYIARDGEEFDNEDDCIMYEEFLDFMEIYNRGDTIKLYNANGKLLTVDYIKDKILNGGWCNLCYLHLIKENLTDKEETTIGEIVSKLTDTWRPSYFYKTDLYIYDEEHDEWNNFDYIVNTYEVYKDIKNTMKKIKAEVC